MLNLCWKCYWPCGARGEQANRPDGVLSIRINAFISARESSSPAAFCVRETLCPALDIAVCIFSPAVCAYHDHGQIDLSLWCARAFKGSAAAPVSFDAPSLCDNSRLPVKWEYVHIHRERCKWIDLGRYVYCEITSAVSTRQFNSCHTRF